MKCNKHTMQNVHENSAWVWGISMSTEHKCSDKLIYYKWTFEDWTANKMRSWCAWKGAIQHFYLWCSPHNLILVSKLKAMNKWTKWWWIIIQLEPTRVSDRILHRMQIIKPCTVSIIGLYRKRMEYFILSEPNWIGKTTKILLQNEYISYSCCWFVNWLLFALLILCTIIRRMNTPCAECVHLVCQTFNFTWNHIIFFFHFLLLVRFCVEIIFNFSDAFLYPIISDNIKWIVTRPVHPPETQRYYFFHLVEINNIPIDNCFPINDN